MKLELLFLGKAIVVFHRNGCPLFIHIFLFLCFSLLNSHAEFIQASTSQSILRQAQDDKKQKVYPFLAAGRASHLF
jgi:hypothetical protein